VPDPALQDGRTRAFEAIKHPMTGIEKIRRAQGEWEATTTPHPLEVYLGKKVHRQDFRRFGRAIAWLDWDGENGRCDVRFMQSLESGAGHAKSLVEFLKSLAIKHSIRLFGNVHACMPHAPVSGRLLDQKELEAWYERRGFRLHRPLEAPFVEMWFPDRPAGFIRDPA